MVGEHENSIQLTKKDNDRTGSEVQNATYARRKQQQQQAKYRDDAISEMDSDECRRLVDAFVHDVIERAKQEYLNGNPGALSVGNDVRAHTTPSADQRTEEEIPIHNNRLREDEERAKGEKNKHKRRHNYKYSGPVDERDVAEYDVQEAESLIADRHSMEMESSHPRGGESPFYHRLVSSFRRIMSCCFGKT